MTVGVSLEKPSDCFMKEAQTTSSNPANASEIQATAGPPWKKGPGRPGLLPSGGGGGRGLAVAEIGETAGPINSAPGEHRLLEVGDAGDAAEDQFAELVDQSRSRGVDVLLADVDPDHRLWALRNGLEGHRVVPGDLVETDAVHRS